MKPLTPYEEKHSDAPDEFAEFLGSGEELVSLHTLGGYDNPFITDGIYQRIPEETSYLHCCANCGKIDNYKVTDLVACSNCGAPLTFNEDERIKYKVNDAALAKFISDSIGCSICRQYQKTAWIFGQLNGHDVFFVSKPTEKICRSIKSSDNAVLIVGENNLDAIPEGILNRTIQLSRLLYAYDGHLNIAQEILSEKITLKPPAAVAPCKRGTMGKYVQAYKRMIVAWLGELKANKTTGEPTKKWIQNWFIKNVPGMKVISVRQIYRHLNALLGRTDNKANFDTQFMLYWTICKDGKRIQEFSSADMNDKMIKAMETHNATIKTMRSCDAAEYADKIALR